jgi:hypothetical protein
MCRYAKDYRSQTWLLLNQFSICKNLLPYCQVKLIDLLPNCQVKLPYPLHSGEKQVIQGKQHITDGEVVILTKAVKGKTVKLY